MSDATRTTDRDTKQVAREQGQQVKGSAQDAASNVAGTAGDRARDLKQQAGTHARGIAGEATRQVRSRAEQETERAGAALGQAGSQLQALAEGNIDDAGVLGEYAQQAAQTVNRWADTVQDRGLEGLLDDMRGFARRRPGMFLLGALAAGVVAGRFGRNLREELSDDGGSPQPLGSGSSAPAATGTTPAPIGGTPSSAGAPPDERTAEFDIGDVRGSAQPPSTPPGEPRTDDVIVGHQQTDPTRDQPRSEPGADDRRSTS